MKRFLQKRATTASLLLFCCCATLLPIPFSASPDKDQSVPYPCMNRPCGCDSAEQCWKSCCCFSNRQKVEWAKKNSITVPRYVVDAAKQESLAKSIAGKTPCPHCVTSSKALVVEAGVVEAVATESVVAESGSHSAVRVAEMQVAEAKIQAVQVAADGASPIQGTASDAVENDCEDVTGCDKSPASDVAKTSPASDVAKTSPASDVAKASPASDVAKASPRHLHGVSVLECHGLQSLWQILSMSNVPTAITLLGIKSEAYFQCTVPMLWECERAAPEPPPRLV